MIDVISYQAAQLGSGRGFLELLFFQENSESFSTMLIKQIFYNTVILFIILIDQFRNKEPLTLGIHKKGRFFFLFKRWENRMMLFSVVKREYFFNFKKTGALKTIKR